MAGITRSEPTSVLIHPGVVAASVAERLDLIGWSWKVVDGSGAAADLEPEGGWGGAVISVEDDPEVAFGLATWLRRQDTNSAILILTPPVLLADVMSRSDLFDDFWVTTAEGAELDARLDLLLVSSVSAGPQNIITYGPLSLNVETYQAVIDGRALDLTYMEYELLRYLAAQPGKVFGRDVLLSEVWGYDYYGGARTVDVHIRRLRAKLGEEHAGLISTVRSVGYRFGQARWG